MKKKITIEDVKKRKIQLESDILELLQGFEKETGVRASYMTIERKGDHEKIAEPTVERSGPINNVDVSMELNLLY
jgi:hypothetical protein